MSISDEAAQAAVKAWQALDGAPGSWTIEGNMRAALEAAAPYMLAEAWDAGMSASKLQNHGIKQARNPYVR